MGKLGDQYQKPPEEVELHFVDSKTFLKMKRPSFEEEKAIEEYRKSLSRVDDERAAVKLGAHILLRLCVGLGDEDQANIEKDLINEFTTADRAQILIWWAELMGLKREEILGLMQGNLRSRRTT